jgi:hypothetical protein
MNMVKKYHSDLGRSLSVGVWQAREGSGAQSDGGVSNGTERQRRRKKGELGTPNAKETDKMQ